MRRVAAVVLAGIVGALPLASAQDISPGKYSGSLSYVNRAGKRITDGVELKIDKVEGSAVHGTVIRYFVEGPCRNEVPVEGVLAGDKLTVRSVKGAPELREGCGFKWELKIDGQKLEGMSASGVHSLQLSK